NGHSVVQGQLLTVDAIPIGSVLDISSPGAVATNSETTGKGHHLIVWMESTCPTNEWHTRGRAVMSDGAVSEISTLSSAPSQRPNPVAVAFGNTEAIALWSREVGPFGFQRYNGNGTSVWDT